MDWSDLCAGTKTEFRTYNCTLIPACPRPAVLWMPHPYVPDEVRTQMVVLEECSHEPLGAISEDGLRREGFPNLGEFRRYFALRYPTLGFRPLHRVQVHRVRVFTAEDVREWGEWALRRLYGDALPT